jgi:arsenite-transporting ATPase
MDDMFGKMEKMKDTAKTVNEHMKDSSKTTFVAVCIPEFLSMYET